MGRPLKIAKAQAVMNITATNAGTNQVTVSGNLVAEGHEIIAGTPFVVATTVGTLAAGTTYWILSVVDATHFTVSDAPLSANPTATPYALGTVGPVTASTSFGIVDWYFNNPNGVSNTYSVVGGNTAIYGPQVLANVAIAVTGNGTIYANTVSSAIFGDGTDFANDFVDGTGISLTDGTFLGFITDTANATATTGNLTTNALANAPFGSTYVYATEESGYIVRQKGKQKYLVHGMTSGLEGACYTANVAAGPLAPGEMSIGYTDANRATGYVQSLSDHTAELFTSASSPVATDNIDFANSAPAFVTFNAAESANTTQYGEFSYGNAQPYPIVTIDNA